MSGSRSLQKLVLLFACPGTAKFDVKRPEYDNLVKNSLLGQVTNYSAIIVIRTVRSTE